MIKEVTDHFQFFMVHGYYKYTLNYSICCWPFKYTREGILTEESIIKENASVFNADVILKLGSRRLNFAFNAIF